MQAQIELQSRGALAQAVVTDHRVKPFSDAVALLADVAYTRAPVQTEFDWHIILREESRTSEPPTLESIRDVLKQCVEQANFRRYLEDLRK